MNGLQGTIKNGQIVLDAPAALPEGTRVEVLPDPGGPADARHGRGRLADDRGRGSQLCWPGWTRSSRDGSRRTTTTPGGRPYGAERVREDPVLRGRGETAEHVGMTRFLLDTGTAGDYIHRRRRCI